MDELRTLIQHADLAGIRKILSSNGALANEGISLGAGDNTLAHPLHRICDGVHHKIYSEDDAVSIAKIFLEFGANVDGNGLVEMKDTPLVAAASLYADKNALLYLNAGANIFHGGCHGGTALHWAAWCGRDVVVEALIQAGAEINRRCVEFKSTPLFWAIHGLKFGGHSNVHHQLRCAKLLLQAGADKRIPNAGGNTISEMLSEVEASELFN